MDNKIHQIQNGVISRVLQNGGLNENIDCWLVVLLTDWSLCPNTCFYKYKTTDFKVLIICSTKETLKARSTVKGLNTGTCSTGEQDFCVQPDSWSCWHEPKFVGNGDPFVPDTFFFSKYETTDFKDKINCNKEPLKACSTVRSLNSGSGSTGEHDFSVKTYTFSWWNKPKTVGHWHCLIAFVREWVDFIVSKVWRHLISRTSCG